MMTRSFSRSAACLLALALVGTLAIASVRTNTASVDIATAPALAGLDVPALAMAIEPANLPLLSVHDPI